MDGKSDLLTKIRESLAAYDDDALVALANKGLFRRAQKDLEELSPEIVGEVDGKLRVRFGDALVDLREAPVQSTCNCPSGGICRHILATLLFLRKSSDESEQCVSCECEILAVDEDMIRKWAGSTLMKRAMQKLAQGFEVTYQGESPILFTIPALNVNCRWMPGGGLNGMVCDCHAATVCEHRVIAVLAYRASKGLLEIVSESQSLEVPVGTARTREDILVSVRAVIHEMVSQGLSRVSLSTEQRLQTLAVSAHGFDLPRLERLLRGLADEVRLQLTRDAGADTRNLFNATATAEALCCALEHPTQSTVGAHKSQYMQVGSIELTGLGARRWRSRSGYAGLTVYLWDKSASNWATWTDARPLTVGEFDAVSRYRQAGPWEGSMDPAQTSRSEMRLTGAWRNTVGRISGRSSTRALILGETNVEQVPGISEWKELIDCATKLFGGGLRERDERDEIVLLRPAHWGEPAFDEIRQEMGWPISDSAGMLLNLVLSHTPETKDAIKTIERIDRLSLQSVLGVLHAVSGKIVVEPIALHGLNGQINLTLDNTPRAPAKANQPQIQIEEIEEPKDETDSPNASTTPLGLLLATVEMELEEIAESGVSVIRDLTSLQNLSKRLEALGITSCSYPVDRVVRLLGKPEEQTGWAEAVLQAYYVCRLASAQEMVQSMMFQ